jgi:pyridoxal biosynthesis lyase PdxS
MSEQLNVGEPGGLVARATGTQLVKRGLAEMLEGGVIMDVVDADQARIAEDAGAVAVMALERVPSDIRRDGGVARMSDPEMIEGIQAAVTIPVMAKARIGHFVEAQILQALGVDYVDESEVLTPPTRPTTSTSGRSPCRSCAGPPTSGRRCVASPRGPA